MLYVLDTDICSYVIKENNESIKRNLIIHQYDNIRISAVTRAELMFGVIKNRSKKLEHKVRDFLQMVDVVPFDSSAADIYATLRNDLELSGTPIGNMDMLIASCALSLDAVLVTNNEKHFSNIKRLKIENWTK